MVTYHRSETPLRSSAEVMSVPLPPHRLRGVRKAYTTRHAAAALEATPQQLQLLHGVRPVAGDLVLAEVLTVGKHRHLEGPDSRRQALYPGHEILVAYGDRYAPDQFLGVVPADLGACHLIAAGGIAGQVLEAHAAMAPPTELRPLGLIADEGGVVTMARFAALPLLAPRSGQLTGGPVPKVIAVAGTSMNSGKSTVLASMVNGLTRAGLTVSAAKVTGTGAGNDPNAFRDAGATRVIDFTDFGHPSTFGLAAGTVEHLLRACVEVLSTGETDVLLLEVADGLYQTETAALLASAVFAELVDGVLFAAQDALGAAAGAHRLLELGHRVLGVSGVLTSSPLAASEASVALASPQVPVIATFDLREPAVAGRLVETLDER